MSEFEPDGTDFEVEAPCKPQRPLWVRILRGLGITVLTLVVLGVVGGLLVYNYGGMSGSAVPGISAQYDQLVAAGQVPALEKRFVIPIPGCTCHSKDPVLTAKHARRRMNECNKCHNTNPAHNEPGVL